MGTVSGNADSVRGYNMSNVGLFKRMEYQQMVLVQASMPNTGQGERVEALMVKIEELVRRTPKIWREGKLVQ